MIENYNIERERCHKLFNESVNKGIYISDPDVRKTFIQNIKSNDERKISWSSGLANRLCKDEEIMVSNEIRQVVYRP